MVVELSKTPKNVTIIEGFPGFGLVGTITTEYLLDHLQTEEIGKIWMDTLPALAAIHEGKVVRPISIHYNKKYNIILIHGVTATQKIEWQIADEILEVAKKCNAKQILSIEGIGSASAKVNPKVFYYSSLPSESKRFEKNGLLPLKEGIIVGVTGALMLRIKGLTMTAIFAETASQMPDSRSAANVIKLLDKLLGLKIDTKPLLKQADVFEKKVTSIMESSKSTQENAAERAKNLSYMG
jgi:uncharacterized protein